MVEVRVALRDKAKRKTSYSFSYGSSLSAQKYSDILSFPLSEQAKVKRFLKKMDEFSYKSRKLRSAKKSKQLQRVDVAAKNALLFNGKLLFKLMKKKRQINVSRFEDLFGEDLELSLVLDENARKFPWELAFDGEDYLCNKYDVGRKVETSTWVRQSGIGPEHKKALVVGLNYKWKSKDWWLKTPEREVLSVKRQLEKKGYSVKMLRSRGEEATIKDVCSILSEGVTIFHFSGHGAYKKNQPEGRRGALVLRDGDLNEEHLKECFNKAKGAPFLSFLNACQSAKEIYSSSFMDAFLEYGSEYVIGTFWSVYDQPSKNFATRFYRGLANGLPIAHALNLARRQFTGRRALCEAATWPSFVLYGSTSHWLPRAP